MLGVWLASSAGAGFVDVTPALLAVTGSKDCGPSFVDLDRDGDWDLVSAGNAATEGVRVFRNDGGLVAWTDVTATSPDLADPGDLRGLLPADLTHDGWDDLVRVGIYDVQVFVNAGPPDHRLDLVLTFAYPNPLGDGFEGSGLADVDGDGWLDLVLTGGDLGNWVLWNPADGTAALVPDDQDDDGMTPPPDNSDFATVGDWDLDGDPDVVVRTPLGGLDAFVRDGTTWVADPLDLDGSNANKNGVVLCDPRGVGALDLLWSAPVAPVLQTFEWTGTWSVLSFGHAFDVLTVRSLTCADLDNDGLSDVMLSADGAERWLTGPDLLTGGTLITAGNTLGTGAADLDADGDLDLYLSNDLSANVLLENTTNDGHAVSVVLQANVGACDAPVLRSDFGGWVRAEGATSRLELSGGMGRGQVGGPALHVAALDPAVGGRIEVGFAHLDALPVTIEVPAGVTMLAVVSDDPDGDGVVTDHEGGTPTTSDTDADGLLDAADPDADGDGWGDAVEAGVPRCTPPVDTDGDGLADLVDLDSDDDGLLDADPYEPDRVDADVDDDGLPDGAELDHATDPWDPDSDGDGVTDGAEVAQGSDPTVFDPPDTTPTQTEPTSTDPTSTDPTGTDPTGSEPVDTGSATGTDTEPDPDVDSDGDGLTDAEEAALGTDPTRPDTDGDGSSDAVDPFPLDPGGTTGPAPKPGSGWGCRSAPGPGSAGLLLIVLLSRRRVA